MDGYNVHSSIVLVRRDKAVLNRRHALRTLLMDDRTTVWQSVRGVQAVNTKAGSNSEARNNTLKRMYEVQKGVVVHNPANTRRL